MGKLGNALHMLVLLRSRGRMKIIELAEQLEVSERMIRIYKDEFEKAGIYIHSKQGKDGGYYLDDETLTFNLGLDESEISSFLIAEEFLEKEDNYMFLKEYKRGVDKIKSVFKKNHRNNDSQYILKFSKPNVDLESERKKYFDIMNSIISRRKLKIKYFSLTSGLTERIIMPYVVVMYKGFWYCIGHCEMREEIRFFKLSRIRSYEVMEDNFEIPADFKLTDYIGHNSIFKDKLYKVKLRIKFPMSIIISERVWSEDQKIKFNKDDNSILFEATMSGLPEIKTWILSMGSYAEVIQPKGLYEEIKNEVKKLKNLYKD